MYRLFDGVSDYILWDNNIKNNNFDFKTNLQKELAKYKEGERFDFAKVPETLSELNNVFKCSGNTYRLYSRDCEGVGNCLVISTLENYEIPPCVADQAKGQTLFEALYGYVTKEDIYI